MFCVSEADATTIRDRSKENSSCPPASSSVLEAWAT
jgi:hypothetical protein